MFMKRKTTEQFIEDARKVHGDDYIYTEVEYKNNSTKVKIICPKHGEFWQEPGAHLRGNGCPICGQIHRENSNRKTLEKFIEEARKVHGDFYDYSESVYKNIKTKIGIICPIHGKFWQRPYEHLKGSKCPDCANKHYWTTESFIRKAKEIHCDDDYDYSKTEYKGIDTKVTIICKKHGEFQQTPYHHLQGNGCPLCRTSKLEKEIEEMLKENNINYIRNTRKILGKLELDYFFPDKNIAIECQGIQHFKPSRLFGEEEYQKTLKRDEIKRKLCEKKGIKLFYYSNLHIDYPYKVYENKEELLEIIQHANNTNLS